MAILLNYINDSPFNRNRRSSYNHKSFQKLNFEDSNENPFPNKLNFENMGPEKRLKQSSAISEVNDNNSSFNFLRKDYINSIQNVRKNSRNEKTGLRIQTQFPSKNQFGEQFERRSESPGTPTFK